MKRLQLNFEERIKLSSSIQFGRIKRQIKIYLLFVKVYRYCNNVHQFHFELNIILSKLMSFDINSQ